MRFHWHRWWTMGNDEFLVQLRGVTFCRRCGRVKGRDDFWVRWSIEDPNPGAALNEASISFELVWGSPTEHRLMAGQE